jgi:ABC-type nitrate/sulfonate/bicarbonate transport systems, periplasmic components
MLEEAGLSFSDIQATSLAPRDGFAAFNAGSLDAWAIYGYNVPLAISQTGARVLKNANGYLSGNYLYYGHPSVLADPQRRAASADLLVRLQRACTWFGQHQDAYAKVLSAELRVPEEAIRSLYRNQSQARRVTGVTAADIASEQQVADTFARAAVIDRHVDVAPLWTDTFNAALARRCVTGSSQPTSEHSMTQALRPDRLRAFVGRIASLVDEHAPEAHLLEAGGAALRELIAHDDWLPDAFAQPDPSAINNSCCTRIRSSVFQS